MWCWGGGGDLLKKEADEATLMGLVDSSAPAALMPTIPATRMQMQERMERMDNWSNVRGKERMVVGMAKMPVYSIRQSRLPESVESDICPARS